MGLMNIKASAARLLLRIGRGRRIYRYLINRMGGDYRKWADWLREVDGMRIGANTSINPKAELMDWPELTIGSNCSISACTFVTHSGGDRIINNAWGFTVNSSKPIVVGNNCIIGINATIMYGVTIGDNCVIGAGSYVCRDVPSGTVVRPPEAAHAGTTDEYVRRLKQRAPSLQRVMASVPFAKKSMSFPKLARPSWQTLVRIAVAFGAGAMLVPSPFFE